ncbi:uncharacterized protein MELLADRAFT_104814 [Melampsora larici-populina 98AG31]|uniref:F-box domain-containing protein n=1 Tax=Melampsora larici-populina (strain 98AG31 / pathotype 3-4-7) TaxID=747676 RepID=F4RG97_MELLP|nr:uncharacterized protein MELLADRAFT_104814 [Melampsora larici-populina 98AG31]EGG08705.1 hypothetical protein MELLADRAFT_104814 [Melampsora larici-populina 98AG31]
MSTPNHSEQEQPSKRIKSTLTPFTSPSLHDHPSAPAYRTRLRTRSNQTQSPSPSPSSQINLHHSTTTTHHLINLSQDPFPIDPALNPSPNRSPSSPSSSSFRTNCECQSTSPNQILNINPSRPQADQRNPSIINLPSELLEEISNHLSNEIPSLLSLSLTHSQLNWIALKTLYHSPYLDSRYTAWKLRTTLRNHEKLSKFIRVLDIDLNKLCKASMWASWHLQETGGAVVDVLSQCQNLIDLRLQMPKESSMFMQEFILPIRNLSNLQTFYKDLKPTQDLFNESFQSRINPPAWISMLQLLSMIGHLSTLKTLAIRGLGSSLSSKPIFKSQPISSFLINLIIVQTSIKERDLQQLLRYNSGLKSLTLIESTCISKRGLVEALQACGKSLEELIIGPGWWGKSDTSFPLDDVIGSLNSLKKLNVEGDLISPEFFKSTYQLNHQKTHQSLTRLNELKVKKSNTFKFRETLIGLKDMIKFHSTINPGLTSRGGVGTGGGLVGGGGGGEGEDGWVPPIKLIELENLGKLGWKKDEMSLVNEIYYPGTFVI